MPISPDDATTKDVLYPDDLPGENLVIDRYAYWDAADDEDAAELPEDAQYGLWLPVTNGTDKVQWAAAPRAMRKELQRIDAEDGTAFRVDELEKGPGDSDPYHVQVTEIEDGDPL